MAIDNVLENIKEKLKKDSNYDLSISELDVLSKCSYETIKQIFGKDFVARTPNEITINTICYVGDLDIKESLPTYNLRYIFGDLDICINNINLENLKFISRFIYHSTEVNLEELELDELIDNKPFIMYKVFQDVSYLRIASERIKNDKDFMLNIVKYAGEALEYAPEKLRNDREIVLAAVKQNAKALEYASSELKNDKEVVLEVVKQMGCLIHLASEGLRNNKEIVLTAVKNNGYALRFASKELQNDKEVVLEAVKKWGPSLEYASEELQHYFEKHGIETENKQNDVRYQIK